MATASPRLQKEIRHSTVHTFIDDIFGEDMHAKRVQSLSSATMVALQSCSLAVRFTGQGLAQAHDLKQKHCIKQVDRLFSNPKSDVCSLLADWVQPHHRKAPRHPFDLALSEQAPP